MKDENQNNQHNGESGNFGLPAGYFQKSAAGIMNKIAWQEEHTHFPELLALKGSSPFLLPEHYFYKNALKLELLEHPALKDLKHKNPFSVPQNYFEDAEVSELSKMAVMESDAVFPKLQALQKQNAFNVPGNYFAENEKTLALKLAPVKQARILSLFSKRIRFAAAALLLLTLGIWLFNFYSDPVVAEDCGTIACLDKQDIMKSKSLERLDEDELYDLVDPSVLEKKLKQTKTEIKPKDQNDQHPDDPETQDLLDEL